MVQASRATTRIMKGRDNLRRGRRAAVADNQQLEILDGWSSTD